MSISREQVCKQGYYAPADDGIYKKAKAAQGARAWFRKHVFHCKSISSVQPPKHPYEDYISMKHISETLDWYTSIATWIGQQALLN